MFPLSCITVLAHYQLLQYHLSCKVVAWTSMRLLLTNQACGHCQTCCHYSFALSDDAQIDQLYGSLCRTMMTLGLTVSGGTEWLTAAAPLVQLGTGHGVI